MRTFNVRAERWEHGWVLHFTDVAGEIRDGVTQSHNLAEAPMMVRDYIKMLHGIDPAEVEVVVTVDLGDDMANAATAAKELRANAERLDRLASAASRRVVAKLVREHGLTHRDAAAYLGISPARVGQLAKEA
jgi:hypothetical protein